MNIRRKMIFFVPQETKETYWDISEVPVFKVP